MGIYHVVYRLCPPVDEALRALVELARGDALGSTLGKVGIVLLRGLRDGGDGAYLHLDGVALAALLGRADLILCALVQLAHELH